jgi:hypothetical protein
MVRVTSVGDPIEARIIAARLGSEGLLWELRGGVSGPYPMGSVHVYVEEHELETATEIINLGADPDPDVEAGSSRAPLALWMVVLAVVAVAAFAVVRVAAGGGMAPRPPGEPVPATTIP